MMATLGWKGAVVGCSVFALLFAGMSLSMGDDRLSPQATTSQARPLFPTSGEQGGPRGLGGGAEPAPASASDNWTNAGPSLPRPSGRWTHAMAYDLRAERVILFGGRTGPVEFYRNETWAYDPSANAWTNMTTGAGPSGRSNPRMAYDIQSDRTILFGGGNYYTDWYSNETWAYDYGNNTWTRMSPLLSPSPRYDHQLVYDSRSDRVILFGGAVGAGPTLLGDTWTYDYESDTWTDMAPAASPPARQASAMAYDSESDLTIVFGGRGGTGNDTWTYNSTANSWTPMSPLASPSVRWGSRMVYDSQADRTVLFGGYTGTEPYNNETWEYDVNADAWVRLTPAASPPATEGHAMAYDSTSDSVVLFGGGFGIGVHDETWRYGVQLANASAPLNLQAIAGDGQVSLQWQPPATDGGSPITNYTVYRGAAPGGELLLATIGNVTSHVDAGLTNGVTYYYQVAAVNAVGEGPRSAEVSATPAPPPTPPSAPRSLQVTAADARIDISWQTPSSDGGSPITDYRIYRGTSSGGESWLIDTGPSLTYADLGVTNRVTYYYYVTARNAVGEGPPSGEVSATPSTVPTAPRNLQASGGAGNVTLAWQPPASDGGSAVTDYRVYRGLAPGSGTLHAVVGNVTAYNESATVGTTYFYQVSAVNVRGEGPRSTEVSVTPVPSPDTTAPRVVIRFPPSGAVLESREATVSGTASDDSAVVLVDLSLDGSVWAPATGTTVWSGEVTLGEGENTIYARATDPSGNTAIAAAAVTVELAPSRIDELEIALVSAAAAAGAVGGVAFAALHFTRIRREEVLQRRVRLLLFDYVRESPGASFSAVRKAIGLEHGVAAYHLDVLEREGLIHSESRQHRRWYYPNGDVSLWKDLPISALQSSLLGGIREAPGIGVRELARAVGRGSSSVAYNVKVMEREGMIRTERAGVKLRCFPAEGVRPAPGRGG